MYNNRRHPLLEQVPLTVSPFVSLPAATTLSYNFKTMPSNIPPSALGISAAAEVDTPQASKPRYVVSGSGHAAHPDDIISSCQALQAHIAKMQENADKELRELEQRIRDQELAEKRRLAPGWLDSESRLLEPQRDSAVGTDTSHGYTMAMDTANTTQKAQNASPGENDEGAQLDRAFGGMAL